MKPRAALVLLVIWCLIPLLVIVVLVSRGIRPDVSDLRKALDSYRVQERSSNDLLEELPRYFDRYPHTAAIILSDGRGVLLGSMYAAQRIPEPEYRQIIDDFRSGKVDPAAPFSKQNAFLPFTYHAADRYSLYFLLRHKLPFAEYWLHTKKTYPQAVWLMVGYFVLGFVAAGLLYAAVNGSAGKRQRIGFAENSRPLGTPANAHAKVRQPGALRPLQLENQIHSLFARLNVLCPFSRAIYYVPGKGGWQALLQKRGNLTVRGELLPPAPEILNDLAQRASWDHPICNATKDEAILPVRSKGELMGALYLTAANMLPFAEMSLHQAMQEVSLFAREFHIKRSFETAAVDEDTGFFTAPYFQISLKERLLSGRPFATAIFEIPAIDRVAPATLVRWARAVSHHVNPPGSEGNNAIARLDRTRIAIIFDFALTEHERDIEQALATSRELQNLTSQIMGLKLYGAIVPRSGDLAGIELYLRRLENALMESKGRDDLRIITHSSPRAVL